MRDRSQRMDEALDQYDEARTLYTRDKSLRARRRMILAARRLASFEGQSSTVPAWATGRQLQLW